MQDAYQRSLAKGSITSAAQAYSALQNYYNICLPQSIEDVVLQKMVTTGTSSGDTASAPALKVANAKIAPKGTSTVIQKTPN